MRDAVASAVAAISLAGCAGAGTLPPPSLPSVTTPSTAVARCSGIAVRPGPARTIQTTLNAHPGATFCFAAGTYRFDAPIQPRTGQRLIAAGAGTVLTGAKVVGRFVRSGSSYRAPGFLANAAPPTGYCLIPTSGCSIAQDVFLDGVPLTRAMSRARLARGTFYEDFRTNEIWLHDDPSGHLVEQAYAPAIIASDRGGVSVIGFTIEMAANPAQHGAVQAQGYRGKGWIVRGNEIRFNHGAGISSAPPDEAEGGSTIVGNFVHDNGQEGIAAIGNGLVVENNEIAFNNRLNYACGWDCGGAKFAGSAGNETEHLTVTGNYVHDNVGPGFWSDIDSYDMTFTKNRIVGNRQTTATSGYQTGAGIFLEISDRATIAGNVIEDNGPVANSVSPAGFYQGGQIVLAATPNVSIHDNTIGGAAGVGMLQQDRYAPCAFGASASPVFPDGTPVCPFHYHFCPSAGKCIDNYTHWVHDESIFKNRIAEAARSGNAVVAGLDCDLGGNSAAIFSSANGIVYRENTYTLQNPNGRYFDWTNGGLTKDGWLAAGQDQGSTFR